LPPLQLILELYEIQKDPVLDTQKDPIFFPDQLTTARS
jgi:hypothetical protein